jgi:hypothetical protein
VQCNEESNTKAAMMNCACRPGLVQRPVRKEGAAARRAAETA